MLVGAVEAPHPDDDPGPMPEAVTRIQALKDVSFSIAPASLTAVIGPVGAGTVFLKRNN
jgi:ABC-type multidrug transport system ATPase subunit